MAARYDISILTMQDRYDYAFLRNDARPATVVVHEEFAERSEREAFRSQFLQEHRGVDNAGKPIFVEATPGDEELNRTFHIEQLGLSQKDAEFIARGTQKIDAVCIAMGTPLSILGNASGRTFDNAGQEYANWWEGTVIPLMDEFEDAVNMQVAPRLGKEVGWFDVSHVAALKKQSKIVSLGAAATTFIDKKVLKINEVREAYDLEPLTDAELKEIEDAAEEAKQLMQANLAGKTDPNTPPDKPKPPEPPKPDERHYIPTARMKVVSDEGEILVLERTA
jgi:phage portal protein BeeE